MVSFEKGNEIFERYISDYHMNLITLGDLREENFQTGVRELVGFLRRSRSKAELQRYCMENEKRIRKLDEDTFDAISILIDQPDFVNRKESYRKGEGINMCQAMADWKEDILKEGIEQGIEQGIQQGIKALILDNLDEGVSEKRIIEKLQKRFALGAKEAKGCFARYSIL